MAKEAVLCVWINAEEKVASFHAEDGYEQKDFTSTEFYSGFLQSLIEAGYRFM